MTAGKTAILIRYCERMIPSMRGVNRKRLVVKLARLDQHAAKLRDFNTWRKA